ncbi:MAG: tetratricopeptide repeat protein [Bacteroidales bacterium]|nr:tetratricopeptide repeat protein [Bacteroidales bacterium]
MKNTLVIFALFLLVFNTSVYGQSLKVEIGEFPSDMQSILDQYTIRENYEKYSLLTDVISEIQGNPKVKVIQHTGYNSELNTYDSDGKIQKNLEAKTDSKGVLRITDLIKNSEIKKIKIKGTDHFAFRNVNFSLNGEFLVAIGYDTKKFIVNAYLYNVQTGSVIEKSFKIEKDINSFAFVSSSGDGKYAFVKTKSKYGYIQLNFQTGGFDLFQLDELKGNRIFMYAYPDSKYLLVSDSDTKEKILYDVVNKKQLFKYSVSEGDLSFFTPSNGDSQFNISGKTFQEPGVGVIRQGSSFVVFNQNADYFTVSESSEQDIKINVKFNDQTDGVESQPNLIPIISDELKDNQLVSFCKNLAKIGGGYANRQQQYTILESAEPYSTEFFREFSKLDGYAAPVPLEYFGKPIVQWVNSTSLIELTTASRDDNKALLKFIEFYKVVATDLRAGPFSAYAADESEVNSAINKVQTASADLYYMTVDELIENGNKAFTAGATLGPTASLLSIKYYEVAAEKEPNDPLYQQLIGNAYTSANQFDKAIASYNKALALKPDYSLALFGILTASFIPTQTGQNSLNDNLAKSIIENANRFLAAAPADFNPAIMAHAKRFKGVCQLYIADKDLYARYNQANGFENTEDRVNAISGLVIPIENTGNKYLAADMANTLGFDLTSIAKSKNNEFNSYLKADAMFAKAVQGGVNDPKTYYQWASINLNQLKKNEEALRIIEEGRKLYPNDKDLEGLGSELYFHKGKDLYLAKSYTKAAHYFESYINAASDPIVSVNGYLGLCYFHEKKYHKAVEYLEKLKDKENANTIHAFYPNFNDLLAFAKNPAGTAPIAKDKGGEIEAMFAKYENGVDMQGAEGLKLMEEAANYFDQIDFDLGQAITHSGIGVAYHRAGNTSVAKGHYEKSIENGAQSSSSYNNLALIYLNENSLSNAKSVLDNGWSKFPNATDLKKTFADYFLQLGIIEYQNKSYGAAIPHFNKSISYFDSYADTYLYLGFSYYANGETSNAKTSLRNAVKLNPQLRNDYPFIDQLLSQ